MTHDQWLQTLGPMDNVHLQFEKMRLGLIPNVIDGLVTYEDDMRNRLEPFMIKPVATKQTAPTLLERWWP